MATYKPQIKTNSGVEDIEIDASTLDGKDSSYYLNYNNLTNKPTISSTSGFLPKTTYEWNKEIAFSNTGKLCIGKFPMYDSNLTVEIKATTSKTYSAILVIATQNVKNTQLGTLTANVYGDPNNDVGKNIYIEHVSGSNMIGVYFSPEALSKNLIHIQAVALNTNANYGSTAATDICKNVSSIPTTATKQPTNALTSVIPTKTSQLTNDSGFKTTDTDTTYTFANGTNSFTVTPKGGTAQTVTVTPSIANATTSKAGLMSSTDKTNLNTLSNLLGDDSDAVVNKINEVIEIFDSYPEGDKIADALAGKQSKVAALGSTTKPVYVSAAGTFAATSTYAGGTKVTLNGTDKGASTASLYAPTTVGTSGQILKSNGTGAPTWVAQSVIDLGTITEDPISATNSVLNAATEKGLYAFKWSATTPTRILQCYMEVSSVMDWVYQLITIFDPAETQFTEKKISRYYAGRWQINTNAFFTVLANKQLGTSGQVLMSDGSKAYWGTISTNGGGTASGDYLPKSGGIMTGDIIFDKNKAKGIRVASYNTSGKEQLNQVILTSDTTQTIVGNKQQDNVKLLGSDAPVWNDGTNEHTILTSKGGTINGNLSVGGNLVMNGGGSISGDSASFHTMNVATKLNLSGTKKITYDDTYEYTFPDKSGTVALLSDIPSGGGGTVSGDYLPKSGGTITGDLTITYDSEGNGGSFYSSYIGMTDGEYSYGGWYADEGIYLGTGDEAQFYPYGLTFNGDNSRINLNGSNSNIFIPSVCGLINNADGNAFGFDDAGYPTILNHDGRYLQIATDELAGNYEFYEFPEYSGCVPVTATQGTSGQVLTSNGNGTYKWSTLTSGGTSGGSTSLEFTLLDDVTLDFAGEGGPIYEIDFERFGCSEYMFWVNNSDETTTKCYDDYSSNFLTLGANNVITLKKAGNYWIGQNTGDYNFDGTQSTIRTSTVILDTGSNLRFGNQAASGYIMVKIFGRG